MRRKTAWFIGFICFGAILVRLFWLGKESIGGDLENFLEPWFEEMKAGGGFAALKNYPGNYNAPYMTILAFLTYLPLAPSISVRVVSYFFDFLLAIAAVLLALELMKGKIVSEERRLLVLTSVFSLVLFLPTVVSNSGMWAQCDSIYAAFAILSLVFLCREKYAMAVLLLGASFAFKLQAVFLLPVFGIVWFLKAGRRGYKPFRFLNFLLFSVPNVLLSVPAILCGMPISRMITIYLGQTTQYKSYLTLNFPNIYALLPKEIDTDLFLKVGMLMTILLLVFVMLICVIKNRRITSRYVVEISIITLMIVVSFLPGMHERYFYVGEVLIAIYVMTLGTDYWLLVVSQLLMLAGYFALGVIVPSSIHVMAICFLGMCCIYYRECSKDMGRDRIGT